jgi:hypothetical protein
MDKKEGNMFDFCCFGDSTTTTTLPPLKKHLVGCRFNGTPHKVKENKDSFLV